MLDFIWLFFIGMYFTLSLYHIIVFLGRTEDKNNIYYSLLGLTSSFWMFSKTYSQIVFNSYAIRKILIYISIMLVALSIALFAYNVLNLKKIKKYLIYAFPVLFVIPIIFSCILIFLHKYRLADIISIIPGVTFGVIYWILASVLFFNKKNRQQIIIDKWKIYIYISISLYYIFYIAYPILILFKMNEFLQIFTANIGVVIMLIMSAYALVYNFNQEHHELEDKKKALEELNLTLEQKVKDRTLQLENKTEELKGSNVALQKANKQIREASQKQTDFFINLAHETRTPLQLILFNLESYVKKVKYSRDLKVIERNFNKLLRDMINFLDLTKLQRGQIFYDHSQIIDLVDVLKLKIDLFKNVAVKKNIKMDLNINVDNAYTKIDSFAIDRVINNLLDNAIKYSNQNGYINVSLKLDGNKIKMVIEDNGIGISEEQQKHIFEPYHQMSHEKRQYQGLGMGLNIVKKITDEVKGIIDIKSELGKGTTFTLVFNKCNLSTLKEGTVVDVFKKSYTNILPALPVESSYDNKKPTLLIVEDNTELVGFLQKELGVEYNIYYAMNGQEALSKIKTIPKPDIILADIMMPVMDGYEMRECLCKTVEYAAIPFIFLTAKTKQNERIKGLQQGAIDFISKPVMIKELTTKLKSILKIQKAQKETEIKNKKRKQKDIYENYKITDKEQEIITLLKKGLEYKEIADKLKISINTVRTHMRRLFYKCNVVNKVEFLNLFKV